MLPLSGGGGMVEQADSVDDWLWLARSNRDLAYLCASEFSSPNAAWTQAGFAVECALKAAIMARERLNSFPSKTDRRELHTHDLGRLARILGLAIPPNHDLAPHWRVVLQWKREHTYAVGEMPPAVVGQLLEAAFSDDGVVPWLCRNYLGSYMMPEQNIWRS